MRLPNILVVDDEIGAEPLFKRATALGRWADRAKERRLDYCRRFGLVSECDPFLDIQNPIARATFVSALRWNGELNTVPDPDLMIRELLSERVGESAGYALVLLDLRFEYGVFDPSDGSFGLSSSTYGLDVLLPSLKKTFGFNTASPQTGWLAIPVIVVSTLPKEELEARIRACGARGMLEKQSAPEQLREALQIHLTDHGLLPDERGIIAGKSLSLLNCLASARRAAQSNLKVLLLGETGTGKELIAAYIHDHSPRKRGPYRVFHAPGRAEGLQEDELFGHVKGAYTGAQDSRPGLIEAASGGTLFVDEIADIGQTVQRSLMRPIEQGSAKRVGASKEFNIDVKFVFATNKDIHLLANKEVFLPDLLSRIEQVTIHLPPLRDRSEDIPILARTLLDRIDGALGDKVRHFLDDGALKKLSARAFRASNVRELENLLRAAASSHRNDPRLTDADFGRGDELKLSPPSTPYHAEPQDPHSHDMLSFFSALAGGKRQWVELTLEEGELAAECLRGAVSKLIVKALELSLKSILLEGGAFSMVRFMGHLWGAEGLSSQQAHRYLDRILKAGPNGAVARATMQSDVLMAEPKIARAARAAVKDNSNCE